MLGERVFMKIEITKKECPITSTNTDPQEYKIILIVTGSEQEIDWYLKRLDRFHKNNRFQ